MKQRADAIAAIANELSSDMMILKNFFACAMDDADFTAFENCIERGETRGRQLLIIAKKMREAA